MHARAAPHMNALAQEAAARPLACLGRVDDCAELVHAKHAQVGDGEGAALR